MDGTFASQVQGFFMPSRALDKMILSMTDNQPIIWVAALSGLAGALLTQLMTGLFSYINDRRKQRTDVVNLYRGKRIEIGENFYFMSGELMAMAKKRKFELCKFED